MKKLVNIIIFIAIIGIFAGCDGARYYITDGKIGGRTMSYTKDDNGCIRFTTINCGKSEITLCSNYSIKKLK